MKSFGKHTIVLSLTLLAFVVYLVFFLAPAFFPDTYKNEANVSSTTTPGQKSAPETPAGPAVTHVATPDAVRPTLPKPRVQRRR